MTDREAMQRTIIECATCGYPLLPEERTGLQEVNGKMVKPWVSLTDEEILSHTEHIGVVRYFERLLREKNYG